MIDITRLTKVYTKGSIPAVNEITVKAHDGEVLGLVGLNGAGKTTLIKISCGLLYPTAGTVAIDGIDMVSEKCAASIRIGMVPEFSNFEQNSKPLSLLRYYAGFYGMHKSAALDRANEVMKLVGLSSELDKKLRNYSQGMKKRFLLAASMLHKPQNYLFDELLTGLDPDGIRFVRKLISDLRVKGNAVILSTHILMELENLADRVAILHKGRLVEIIERDRLLSISSSADRLEDYFLRVIGD